MVKKPNLFTFWPKVKSFEFLSTDLFILNPSVKPGHMRPSDLTIRRMTVAHSGML